MDWSPYVPAAHTVHLSGVNMPMLGLKVPAGQGLAKGELAPSTPLAGQVDMAVSYVLSLGAPALAVHHALSLAYQSTGSCMQGKGLGESAVHCVCGQ